MNSAESLTSGLKYIKTKGWSFLPWKTKTTQENSSHTSRASNLTCCAAATAKMTTDEIMNLTRGENMIFLELQKKRYVTPHDATSHNPEESH